MLEILRTVYQRLTADGSTAEQAVQSGIWVAGINVGDRVLQLLKVIILARLLSPEAFGLLGIALLSIAALRQFSKLGFDEALIQHEEDDVGEYLNTAWVMKVARGGVIAIIAFVAAPNLAVFFGEAQAEPLIRIIGFSPLILGLQNPAVMYFQKNLNFHREFAYQVGGRFMDFVVAAAIALAFGTVWALPIGIVAMNLTKFVLSYGIHDYRPNIEFNLEYGKEMFGFGKWLFASAILMFLYGQGDDAFVGWFFAASSLGVYQLAYRFSNAPATEVTHVIARVAFPTLSKVQDNTKQLREGYFRTVQISTIVAFPMAAGIAAVAPQFVRVILGNQWDPMIPLMQLLAIWGGFRAFGANGGAVFKSVGRPDIGTRIQALKVIIIALSIYPAAEYFGVAGVALAVLGSSLVVLPTQAFIILSIIEGEVEELLQLVLYPAIGSIMMFFVVTTIDHHILLGFTIWNLLSMVLIGVIIYLGFLWAVEKYTRYEFAFIYQMIRHSLSTN